MKKVLFVEDNDSLRNLYAYALNREGFEVTTAQSGLDALGMLRGESKYDVMVLDMLMLEMSGLDLLRVYDVRKKRPEMRVVGFTNFTDNEAIEKRAGELGVEVYLDKAQYEPKALAEYLKAFLDKRSS